MLLFATSEHAAQAVVSTLRDAGIDASSSQRVGRYSVSVKFVEGREAEVLDIARAVDPAVQIKSTGT